MFQIETCQPELAISFSESSLFFMLVLLWTRTLLAAFYAKKKGRESNALTSLAGHTCHPHDRWRCPGQ
jgi:hypothetical protein